MCWLIVIFSYSINLMRQRIILLDAIMSAKQSVLLFIEVDGISHGFFFSFGHSFNRNPTKSIRFGSATC